MQRNIECYERFTKLEENIKPRLLWNGAAEHDGTICLQMTSALTLRYYFPRVCLYVELYDQRNVMLSKRSYARKAKIDGICSKKEAKFQIWPRKAAMNSYFPRLSVFSSAVRNIPRTKLLRDKNGEIISCPHTHQNKPLSRSLDTLAWRNKISKNENASRLKRKGR